MTEKEKLINNLEVKHMEGFYFVARLLNHDIFTKVVFDNNNLDNIIDFINNNYDDDLICTSCPDAPKIIEWELIESYQNNPEIKEVNIDQ